MMALIMKRTVLSTTVIMTFICQIGILHGQSETPNAEFPPASGYQKQVAYDRDPDADIYTEQGYTYPGDTQSSSSSSSYSDYTGQRQDRYRTQASARGSLRHSNPRRISQRMGAQVRRSRQGQVRFPTAGRVQATARRATHQLPSRQPDMPRFSDLGIENLPRQSMAYQHPDRQPLEAQAPMVQPVPLSMPGSQTFAQAAPPTFFTRTSDRIVDRGRQVLPSSAWEMIPRYHGSEGQYQPQASHQRSLPQYETYGQNPDRPPLRRQDSVSAQVPLRQYQVAPPTARSISRHQKVQRTMQTADQHQAKQYRSDTRRDKARSHYRHEHGAPYQVASQYHIDKAMPRTITTHYKTDKTLTPTDTVSKLSQERQPKQPIVSQHLGTGRHTEGATKHQHKLATRKRTKSLVKTTEMDTVYQPSTRQEAVHMVPYMPSAVPSDPTHSNVKARLSQRQIPVSQQHVPEQIGNVRSNPERHVSVRQSKPPRNIPAPSLITIPEPSELVIANEVTRTKIPTKKSNTRQSSDTKTIASAQHVEYKGADKGAIQTNPEMVLDQLRIDTLLHNYNLTATGSVFLSPETRRQNEIALQNVVRRRPRRRGGRRRRV